VAAIFAFMMFSKSFGYAIRGILYVTLMSNEKEKVQLNEIAEKLSVPRYFLAKIMRRIAKEGILSSTKGPHGGFFINKKTLKVPLVRLIELTGGLEQFNTCVLGLKRCDAANPCPLHNQIEGSKKDFYKLFATTTIADLLQKDQPGYIESIAF